MSRLINGQNYFNEASLQEMIEALERGETIRIHIDCIGHARTANETANYVEALKEKFGERLVIDTTGDTEYRLKE